MVSRGRLLGRAVCLAALFAMGAAAAEAPAPTAPATPAPTAPATPAPTAPATPAPAAPAPAKPKQNAVLTSLPDTDGVFGGNVTFSKEAFPVVANGTEPQVQGLLRTARPLLCRTCRSSGKISKKQSYMPGGTGLRTPIVKTWGETCPTCGGYGNLWDPKLPKRLLLLVDRLAHVKRGELFAKLRTLAVERLEAVFEVRDKTWDTYRCEKVTGYRTVWYRDSTGYRHSRQVLTVVGLRLVKDRPGRLHVDAGSLVAKLWTQDKNRPLAGQAALLVGTTSNRTEVGGWVWMKMHAQGNTPRRAAGNTWPPALGRVASAIILCGTPKTSTVPEGRAAVGGLALGTWTPAGRKKDAGIPVILAIVSAAGR